VSASRAMLPPADERTVSTMVSRREEMHGLL
jgi:hypothetical protein